MSTSFVPSDRPIIDPRTGSIDFGWLRFFSNLSQTLGNVPWSDLDFAGSTLADLLTRSASDLNSGTVPLARISGLMNAQIDAAAAIAWSKVSKSGSFLTDIGGAVSQAQKMSQVQTVAVGTQDDFGFQNADSIIANNASALTLRGLAAGVSGQRVTIWVINAQVNLAHQDTNSLAPNRIITTTAGTIALTRYADLEYDGVTVRWRVKAFA